MNSLLEKLRELVVGAKCPDSHGTAPALMIKVRCNNCGETITTRVEKAHAFQEQYRTPTGESGEAELSGYLLEKELLGEKCQQAHPPDHVVGPCTRPLKHEITGGELSRST